VNSQILKTQRIMDQLWILARILDCACLDVRILGPKRNLDHRSFFSLGRYVNKFIQIISFFEQNSFKLRCETVIGIVLSYSHQVCCLLYYLYEINNGIHIYQFTFELLHFCFRMWLWFWIWTKVLMDRPIWWKKGKTQRIMDQQKYCYYYTSTSILHTPIHPPHQYTFDLSETNQSVHGFLTHTDIVVKC